MKLPIEGHCRCGQTHVRINGQPLMETACHCTGCQTMSASAFSMTIIMPEQAFEVIRGEPVVGGLKGKDAHHMFCPSCMTWMFTRPVGMGIVNVRPSILDDHAWFAPFIETFTSEMLPWAKTGAQVSFARFPAMDDYADLMKRYSEHVTQRA